MKKNAKKQAKKVAVKKAVAKKAPAVKKVTPKKEVAKPVKKAVAAKPTVKAEHRKQRGRTAPNRNLPAAKKVVTTKETAKNKKTAPVKWTKPAMQKKLPVVKPQPVKKEEPKHPAIHFAEQEAELFDLTKPVVLKEKHSEQFEPVSGAPKPWGSIMPPFVPVTASTKTIVVPPQVPAKVVPSTNSIASDGTAANPSAPVVTCNPTWTVPTLDTTGCTSSGSGSMAGWHTVVPTRSF